MIDPGGAASPNSDAALVQATSAPAPGSSIAQLSAAIAAHRRGTLELSPPEAEAIGLPRFPAIAAHAAATPRDGGPWAVVTVRSTSALRIHERALVLRLGLAAAGIALCLAAFAAYLVLASRGALALRERLRHADELAHLHEKTQKILRQHPDGRRWRSRTRRHDHRLNRVLRERMPPAALGAPLAQAFPEAPAAVVADRRRSRPTASRDGQVQSLFGEPLALFGEEGPYNLHAVPLEPRFPDARVLLVVEDLSEVRALERQLLRAEKLATVGVLAAGIAHEIGTPLGVVRGRAEYVLGKLGEDHPQRAGRPTSSSSRSTGWRAPCASCSTSRACSRRRSRRSRSAAVVRTVGELLRFEAERRKVTLAIDVPESLPPLLAADPTSSSRCSSTSS